MKLSHVRVLTIQVEVESGDVTWPTYLWRRNSQRDMDHFGRLVKQWQLLEERIIHIFTETIHARIREL